MRASSQAGQIGVIVLLIMVVLLTIGLSLALQTTQEVFLSQQRADSTRVFNAAEAGIEQALTADFSFEGDSTSGAVGGLEGITANYTIDKVRRLETRVFEGITVASDVTGVAAGQGIRIKWSREADCNASPAPASLLLSIYSENAGVTRVRQEAVAACEHNDGFTLATAINDTDGYRFRYILNLQPGDLFVRIKPIYNDTDVKITAEGSWDLPVQYLHIRSTARRDDGDETRIVEVNRVLPTAPSIMDYALYSDNTIIK